MPDCYNGSPIAQGASSGSVPIPDYGHGTAVLTAQVMLQQPSWKKPVKNKALVVQVRVTHGHIGDVVLELISPTGFPWVLKGGAFNITNNGPDGGAGTQMNTAFWSAECSKKGKPVQLTTMASATAGQQPFPGPYAFVSGPSVSQMSSGDISGQWTLRASDGRVGDIGTLLGFSVQVVTGKKGGCRSHPPKKGYLIDGYQAPCAAAADNIDEKRGGDEDDDISYDFGITCQAMCPPGTHDGGADCRERDDDDDNGYWAVNSCIPNKREYYNNIPTFPIPALQY
eukprot:gene13910-14028_t